MKQNKILALLLAVVMVVGLVPSAWATEIVEAAAPETTETVEAAQTNEAVEIEGEPAEGEPVEQAENVLGTGTLNAGTLIYKEPNGESYMVQGTWINNSYAIDILEAEDVDGVTWYRYQPSGTGGSIIEALLHIFSTYPWVKAEDIELDAPIVPPEEPNEDVFVPTEQYESVTENGICVNVSASENAFPDDAVITVSDVTVDTSEYQSLIDYEILGAVAVDISFGGYQPSETVAVRMTLSEKEVPAEANMVVVIHIGENGPERITTSYLDSAPGEVITFAANGFSTYVNVFVSGKYASRKMSDVLKDNARYQIATFNIDLFDYDPLKMNKAMNDVTEDGNGFHFTGYNIEGMGSNNGINNSASTHAKQGILQSTLVDGLPVVNFLNGTDAGKKTGLILFDDETKEEYGKIVYNDIPFEMVYDTQTGYYVYKSSVNHAQLNSEKNKIELYADTLSTQNKYVYSVDFSSATGTNDMTIESKDSSGLKATISETSASTRLDPYVEFPVDDIDASQVSQIYVKAKIPASVGSNHFQLFFDTKEKDGGFNESESFGSYRTDATKIPYTANGDWIEFVIDTSDNIAWTGTISSIRIDLFDGNKVALDTEFDSSASYDVEIAEVRFIQDYENYVTYGGFYPFSEIQDSYPGNDTAFGLETWEQHLLESGVWDYTASRSIFNPSPNPTADLYSELAFGTVIEFDFYLPVDKTGLDGEPLTYYFNGDDDLWVFVDNQLVLDIGGGHGAITGKVNFTEGTWEVDSALTVKGYNEGADGIYEEKTGSISDLLCSTGRHTMRIFYLERGGSVSNCYMKFNLPRTPQGSVAVSKEVKEKNNASTSVLVNEEFEFQISIQNNGTGDYQELTPLACTNFILTTSGGDAIESTTDEDGKFKLKNGQEAVFDIDENFNVTVVETKKEIHDHEWSATTVNGHNAFKLTQLTADGTTIRFNFVNTYENLYGELIIHKTGIDALDNANGETQSTIYRVHGTSAKGVKIDMDVVIVGNSNVVIKHIPIGNYTVEEQTDWSWRYDVLVAATNEVKVEGGKVTETAFENDRTNPFWLSGDSYARNWWGPASDGGIGD